MVAAVCAVLLVTEPYWVMVNLSPAPFLSSKRE